MLSLPYLDITEVISSGYHDDVTSQNCYLIWMVQKLLILVTIVMLQSRIVTLF